MSDNRKYLGAYTGIEQGIEYHTYPQFVNFTRYDDKVRIEVRSRDRLDEAKGYHVTMAQAAMEMPVETFRELLLDALARLD